MEDEVFWALSALLSAEELAAKRAHLAACTLTDGALAEGAAALLLAEELAAKRAHLAACTLTDGALAEGAARLACSAAARHAALTSLAEDMQ